MDQGKDNAPIAAPNPLNVESASAGTAPQTTKSYFAYALTAGVLGIIILIVFSLVMIVYAAVSSYVYTDGFSTDDTYFDYDYGYGYDHDDWDQDYDLDFHDFM